MPELGIGLKTPRFFGYRTHLALTEERLITAAVVASGEKGDGPQLPELIDQSQKNGMEIDTVIDDGAYSGKENLKNTKRNNIKVVVKLNTAVGKGTEKKRR